MQKLKNSQAKNYSNLDLPDSPDHEGVDIPIRRNTGEEEFIRLRKQCRFWIVFLLFLLVILIGIIIFLSLDYYSHHFSNSSNSSSNSKSSSSTHPLNIILLVGDGMGTTYNEAYRIYSGIEETILDKNFVGRYTTRSANSTVTDSANGAFSFACGNLTHNGFIAVDMYANPMGTILEASKMAGKGTGIVSTSRVTHATPASFTSHSFHRDWENLIAYQQATTMRISQYIGLTDSKIDGNVSMIDVMLGGGKRHFIPASASHSKRKDEWNFFETYKEYGWNTLVDTNTSLYEKYLDYKNGSSSDSNVDDILPIAGLFANSHFPFYLDRVNMEDSLKEEYDYPGLLDMSKIAINLLNDKYGSKKKTANGNGKGWFLMIEGSRIDQCGHVNDIPCLINEMKEFNDVLEYVYDFAENDGNTLVVSVADHETGGLALGRGTSVQANKMINYLSGEAPADYNITQYYGSFDYNYLIPLNGDINDTQNGNINETLGYKYGYAYIYDWYPESIAYTKHTSEWITGEILLNSSMVHENTGKSMYTTEEINNIIEYNYLGGAYGSNGATDAMTIQEKEFIESCLKRDVNFGLNITEDELNFYQIEWNPLLMHCITLLMNARTLTGWTSHGHSGADVSISCYGPSCDNLKGHHTNAEVGRILSKALKVDDEQADMTEYLLNMFLNDSLIICDNTQNLGFYGYNHNVSYPWGNLKYGEMCVKQYV